MKAISNSTILSVVCGLAMGCISRLLDIYTSDLGNIFSQPAVWILIGTALTLYAATDRRAMLSVFLFNICMVAAYYAVAILSNGVYGVSFIIGWTVVAVLSPILSRIVRICKRRGALSTIISVGIVLCSVLSSVIMFDRLRVYDFVIDAVLIWLLFFKKFDTKSS